MNAGRWIKRRKLRTKIIFLLFAAFFIAFWFSLPRRLFVEPTSYIIEDADGNLLGATVADDGQWRFPESGNVPDKFAKCIIAYEDKRFYSHPGVDPVAMGRAFRQNISRGKTVSGASTLSMQVIRLSRGKNRTIMQKLLEAVMSMRLELRYSKKEILSLYASHAPFGTNVVGLDAAAWRYYGRSAEKLSWGEMAALCVLPNAPSMVHPGKRRDLLLLKRNFLLRKLKDENTIDDVTYRLALLEPLPGEPLPLPQLAPHLLNRYRNNHRSEKSNAPTRLVTTINAALQQEVNLLAEQHHRHLSANGIENLAALVIDVETGHVLAYTGNVNQPAKPLSDGYVDVVNAPRSPGSLLKPLLYNAMLHEGLILPHSLLPDIPTQIGGYMPQNFDLGYDGAVTAAASVTRSLNIPAVHMLRKYKYARFYEVLRQSGINTLNNPPDFYGLSMVLGGCEVTMWEIAGAYASIARAYNHQHRNKGKFIAEDFHPPVYMKDQKEHHQDNRPFAVPYDATSTWYMLNAMAEVMRPGEEGLWQQFTAARRIAWKTGTSFGFRDGWALGVTPKYVVAVWTGNADGEGRAGLIGVRTAAPLMFDIFRILPASPWFPMPSYDYKMVDACIKSGYKGGPACETKPLMAPANGDRVKSCPYHVKIHLDNSGMFRVNGNCESPSLMREASWFILPPSMEFYYRQKNYNYLPAPPFRRDCDANESGQDMDLYYPQEHARIYIPVEISGRPGEVVFSAAHRRSDARIFWHLDNHYVSSTQHYHKLSFRPAPGRHTLTLVDEHGSRITRSFEVLEK